MQASVAEIILDTTLETPLDYAIPKEIKDLRLGMRVEVPLRGKIAKGTVLSIKETSTFTNIKPLFRKLNEEPFISSDLFALALWMSKYYCCPLSKILKMYLPSSIRNENSHKSQRFVRPSVSKSELLKNCEELRQKYPLQAKILDAILLSPKGLLLSELLEKAGTSASPVQTLCKKNLLHIEEIKIDRSIAFAHEFFQISPKKLNEEQSSALNAIIQSAGKFQTHLLFGVTGSGKTEVYLQAIEYILKLGQSILYLIPEISLTSQTIERFQSRFGNEKLAILHYRLSNGERFDTWHNIHQGKAKIVIGARSAVFSPIKNLGLIIVDEEHEGSFKQSEESPKYHARDVAIMRAKYCNCPIILGTATPSLESYTNALQGKYRLHCLKQRADHAELPKVSIINMRKEYEKNKGFTLFSDFLFSAIQKRYEQGEQTLLFLNRRGYHTSAMCQPCGYVEKCPSCELTLTYHKGEDILSCHLCDFRKIPPRHCPSCNAEGPLKFKGVGTEMVEKTLLALFPHIRVLRLDADTTKHKGSHDRIFRAFRSGKADVLIGTQMIAKGLHFPSVTLVGVISIDGSLHIPDFRSGEQVFQLLTQVAGRSGRGQLSGEVIIQTQLPDHSTILHASEQDYLKFYAEEIKTRETFAFPPFTHLVKFSFTGEKKDQTEICAKHFRQSLIKRMPNEVEIFPAVPCGYAKIKGKYRFQILLKSKKIQIILPIINAMRIEFGRKKQVRLSIDVDPQSTYY